MPSITLTTDFGLADGYVGAMKGAILNINPQVTLVDLSHHIRPHDIQHGAYILSAAIGYFPPGTIHLAVVDPGVGSDRAILAGEFGGQLIVAPDNGLLTLVLQKTAPLNLVRVENQAFFRSSISPTFHGRDIMAPVAAHLSLGVGLDQLGPSLEIQAVTLLDIDRCRLKGGKILSGAVVHVDHFGNLITNIDHDALALLDAPSRASLVIRVGRRKISGLVDCYSQVESQTLLATVGSGGFLEVALNQGHAASFLNARIGMTVEVTVRRSRDENG